MQISLFHVFFHMFHIEILYIFHLINYNNNIVSIKFNKYYYLEIIYFKFYKLFFILIKYNLSISDVTGARSNQRFD